MISNKSITFSCARILSSRSENWSNSISSTSVLVLEVSALSGSLQHDEDPGMVMPPVADGWSMISVRVAMESKLQTFLLLLTFLDDLWVACCCSCCDFGLPPAPLSGVASDSCTSSRISCKSGQLYVEIVQKRILVTYFKNGTLVLLIQLFRMIGFFQ